MSWFTRDMKKKEQKRLDKALYDAARANLLHKARELLDQGANPNAQKGLRPLYLASAHGYKDMVVLLLERGAEVNYAYGWAKFTAIHAAAHNGRMEVVKALLAADADKEKVGGRYNAAGWARDGGHAKLQLFLESGVEPAPVKEDADEVTLTRMLGGRRLEETYNFRDRERITFVRKEEGGAVEAVTRDSFSALGDKTRLREAFAEYARKGGKIPEEEIFPATLTKPKPAAGAQP